MLLSNRFEDAFVFAANLHRKQKRKGTSIPYISHLLAVASHVIEHGVLEDEAIGALLHDAVEDHPQDGKTKEDIKTIFGDKVLSIVLECSDSEEIPKPPWKERKKKYIKHLKSISSSAQLISLADKLHNSNSILRDYKKIGDDLWDRFAGRKDGTLWYYRALVNTYKNIDHLPDSLVSEIDRIVTSIEALSGK